jgi:hypothetical protein
MSKWRRWERTEHGECLHFDVPDDLPAPPCSVCGEECRDLTMSMVGWNPSDFDGFHFFHKRTCDRGDIWPNTLEIHSLMESTRRFVSCLYTMFDLVEANSPLEEGTRRSVADTVRWLTVLALNAIDDAATAFAGFEPEDFAALLNRSWRSRA